MKRGKYAWFHGKIMKAGRVKIPVDCQAVQYGLGCFEGIRFYEPKKGRAVFRLDDHLTRLGHSMLQLGMKSSIPNIVWKSEIIYAIQDLIKKNGFKEGYIRPWVGYTERKLGLETNPSKISFALFVDEWPSYFSKTIRAKISPFIRPHPQSFPMDAKICGLYVNSFLSQSSVKKDGFDEAILFDYNDFVAEAAVSNIFIVPENQSQCKINTPFPESILPCITRETVLEICDGLNWHVCAGRVPLSTLRAASEIFICGTAAEITPVIFIDYENISPRLAIRQKEVGDGKPGPITLKLQKLYSQIVRGEIPEYEHWLTYID